MITSIGEFLDKMGLESRFFDMGRHISELSKEHFQRVESGETAYPAPYLHHAWIGLLFWDTDTPDLPLLWFLKFPLDEQGKLDLTARDQFLKQLLTAVGTNISAFKEGSNLQAVLEGNPSVFTPTPERQATAHAKIKQLLQLPVSQHYTAACDYLQGDLNNWNTLAVQGIADLAIRWPQHQKALLQAIPNMPNEPLKSLCLCLENETINDALSKVLAQRLTTENDKPNSDSELIAALIRGLSSSQAVALRQKKLLSILQPEQTLSIEILAAIGTRCHLDLTQLEICRAFLEQLAQHSQDTFNRIMLDLMFLPALRSHLLAGLRQPERSEVLAKAIDGLFQSQGQSSSKESSTLH